MRAKTPIELSNQYNRLRRELVRMEKYSPYPYQLYLRQERINKALSRYAQRLEESGIDIGKNRNKKFTRYEYAGY